MRIRELPGTRIPLHSHPVDEHITVVQGTWYFAVGDTWDPARLQARAAKFDYRTAIARYAEVLLGDVAERSTA